MTTGFVVMFLGLRLLRWWTVLLTAVTSGFGAIIRSVVSRQRQPQNNLYLAKDHVVTGFAFTPTRKQMYGGQEPLYFGSWTVWGPQNLPNSECYAERYHRYEPQFLAIGITMNYGSDQLVGVDFERLIDIALRIAARLRSRSSLLTSRMFRMESKQEQNNIKGSIKYGMQKTLQSIVSPVVLSMGGVTYRTRCLVGVDLCRKDPAIKNRLKRDVIVNLFLTLRRCCLGLRLHEVIGLDAIGEESLWDELLDWLSPQGSLESQLSQGAEPGLRSMNLRKVIQDTDILPRRIEESLGWGSSIQEAAWWLPQLVIWVLQIELQLTHTLFQLEEAILRLPVDSSPPVSLIDRFAEAIDNGQKLWLGTTAGRPMYSKIGCFSAEWP